MECLPAPYTFSDVLMDVNIYYQVIKMKDSLFLWMGSTPTLGNMAVAMKTQFEKAPTCVQLFGDNTDFAASNMAKRLAMKTGKQVFVSCSLPADQLLLPLVEKRLMEELTVQPQHF